MFFNIIKLTLKFHLRRALPATQKKEVRIQESEWKPEIQKNRGTVAMANNPMEGCAPSQPSFDPGRDRA